MPHNNAIHDFFNVPIIMRGFFIAYGLSLLAAAIPAALVFFYVRDVLGAEDNTWWFLGLYVGSGMLALPFWLHAAKKFGKSHMWFAAMCLSVIVFFAAMFLGRGDVFAYGIVCVGAGLSFGAELALPPLLLRDLITAADDTAHTARRFALLAFLGKAALVLVCLMMLPALEVFSFKPAETSPAQGLLMLSFVYAALPCIIKSAAIFSCWRWITTYGDRLEKTRQPLTHRNSHAA